MSNLVSIIPLISTGDVEIIAPYWAGVQQHHLKSHYGLLGSTEGDLFPEGSGSGPRSCGSSSRPHSWSHLLFWIGTWVGLTVSPVGGVKAYCAAFWRVQWEGQASPSPQEPGCSALSAGPELGPLNWPWTRPCPGGDRGGNTVVPLTQKLYWHCLELS